MTGYQYSEIEPRGVNRKSYEPEIERWLKDTAADIDCVEDADFGPALHLDYTPRAAGPHGDAFWVMGENGIEDEEPMVYGLSDDDLEALTLLGHPHITAAGGIVDSPLYAL